VMTVTPVANVLIALRNLFCVTLIMKYCLAFTRFIMLRAHFEMRVVEPRIVRIGPSWKSVPVRPAL
jgi:hypothetical protein